MCFFPQPSPADATGRGRADVVCGIERRAQGNVLSSDAVFAGRCDLGQWRQAKMEWGNRKINNRPYPRVRGVPLTLGQKGRRFAAWCRPFRARPGRPIHSFPGHEATVSKNHHGKPTAPLALGECNRPEKRLDALAELWDSILNWVVALARRRRGFKAPMAMCSHALSCPVGLLFLARFVLRPKGVGASPVGFLIARKEKRTGLCWSCRTRQARSGVWMSGTWKPVRS